MRPLPVVVAVTFQSTSPVRGTTPVSWWMPEYTEISIHVPREGDDIHSLGIPWLTMYFNPRPP